MSICPWDPQIIMATGIHVPNTPEELPGIELTMGYTSRPPRLWLYCSSLSLVLSKPLILLDQRVTLHTAVYMLY